MSKSTSFAELIDVAITRHWCTRPLCTTCGSHPFRNALKQIPNEDVIAGLRELSDDFLSTNDDMFRLIIQEIAFFHIGGELLEPLAGIRCTHQSNTAVHHRPTNSQSHTQYADAQRFVGVSL